jgi:hypothetical protein
VNAVEPFQDTNRATGSNSSAGWVPAESLKQYPGVALIQVVALMSSITVRPLAGFASFAADTARLRTLDDTDNDAE